VQAVAGQLCRWDVVADCAGLGAFGDQVADEVEQVLLGVSDVAALVQYCGEIGVLRNGLYILHYRGPERSQITATEFLEGNSNLGDAVRLTQRGGGR
jgi:hypothetical protein